MKNIILMIRVSLMITIVYVLFSNCSENDNPIAPYTSESTLKNILIEQNNYNPKITWLGGYVTTLAVNQGTQAALDSSLIWLINATGDKVTYPSSYGQLKSGEESLAESFGGESELILTEDNVYTFWICKENIWNTILTNPGNVISIDSTLSEETNVVNDTLLVGPNKFTKLTYSLDVFINLDESSIQNRGRLGTILIEQTDTSNNLDITWEFTDVDITDLNIAAMGICKGQQFDINNQVWDLYSWEQVDGENIYGKTNLISQPISLGDEIEGTRVFYEFPASGLERNTNYYLWIATNEWNGESRGRTANGYATITFKTW